MTLPLFRFWNRQGESVNSPTIENRKVIAKAELYQVIDVADGTWCRPCRSAGSAHATQIE
ncbi:hypothetical protein [Halocatena salina]|uniref:Uncharacterized protein n=1 Tax=Halocatena salina TaxID=2934340 RepID=A0A8U0A110_9EURY|nr:hypothetical protein [Halocatena salina]UPM42546.1 hypothetical protein MW046_11350 [Halocatena salina]